MYLSQQSKLQRHTFWIHQPQKEGRVGLGEETLSSTRYLFLSESTGSPNLGSTVQTSSRALLLMLFDLVAAKSVRASYLRSSLGCWRGEMALAIVLFQMALGRLYAQLTTMVVEIMVLER